MVRYFTLVESTSDLILDQVKVELNLLSLHSLCTPILPDEERERGALWLWCFWSRRAPTIGSLLTEDQSINFTILIRQSPFLIIPGPFASMFLVIMIDAAAPFFESTYGFFL